MPAILRTRPLTITYNMWAKPHLTAQHLGKTVTFSKLQEAREFAQQNGYGCIRVK